MIGANKDWVVTNIPIGSRHRLYTVKTTGQAERDREGEKCTADYWMTILIRSGLID